MSATGDRRAGFTLLETLTVMGISALAAAIAFPSVDRAVQAVRFDQARAVLLSDLQAARAQALRSGQAVALTPAADGQAYGWSGGQTRRLPANIRLAAQPAGVVFFADGSARPGALVLAGAAQRARLTVSPTGTAFVDSAAPA